MAEASDGLARAQLFAGLFLVVLMKFFEIALDEGGLHRAGTDGIDAKSCWILDGELAGHGDDRAFARAVSKALLDADEAGDGGDVDDCADGLVMLRGSEQKRQKGARDEIDG